MSLWSRVANVFRGERLSREIAEEMESHIAEAVEQGRDPVEARLAVGRNDQQRRQKESSYEIRTLGWLALLRADILFGYRQLKRNKVVSAVAILSLALAMGACIGAFRLIDALLWRPLPVAHAERLYAISREAFTLEGKPIRSDMWAYPSFSLMRDAVKDQAQLIAVSAVSRTDLTYGSDQDMEKANIQYVSGSMFQAFDLQPALGRLLAENDDRTPGSAPYAVLSNDYWTQRFGQDPHIVGRTLRIGKELYQITGVVNGPFTGTEPGTMIDIFLPVMMHPAVTHSDASWARTLVLVKPDTALEPLREKLRAISRVFEQQRAQGFTGPDRTCGRRYLDPSGGIPQSPRHSQHSCRHGSGDCLRQRRQPEDGSVGDAIARNGTTCSHRCRTRPPGAHAPGRERNAGVAGCRPGSAVRVASGSAGRDHDPVIRYSGAAAALRGLESSRFCCRVGLLRPGALWSHPRAPHLRGQAGQRAQGR